MTKQDISDLAPNFRNVSIAGESLEFHPLPDPMFPLYGLAWFERENEFCRFPKAFLSRMNETQQQLAWHTSGARIRFCTDSDVIAVDVRLREEIFRPLMSPVGHSGVDLFLGVGRDSRFSGVARPNQTLAYQGILDRNLPTENRRESNALVYGLTLWDAVLDTIRGDYSDVRTDKMHVDAAAMNLVRRPRTFDVIVGSNLFGDILSDLAGAIVGGLGLLPSANINPTREFPSMFEPVHGSALDIVGQNVANPAGILFSAAMMLEWLGETEMASKINRAAETVIGEGRTTPDLGGRETTESMGDHVLSTL